MTIRRATRHDLSDMLTIENEAQGNPWTQEQFEDELGTKWSTVEVLVEGDAVVGYIVYWDTDVLQILNVSVSQKERRKGHGAKLMAWLENVAKRQEKKIFLEVREHNEGAILFYKKRGFEVIATRENYYSDSQEDGLVMCYEADG